MKNYTPPLINTGKAPFTMKRLFLGSSGSKNFYYRARHKSEDTFLMWIESERFGKTFTFPCVLEEEGDPLVYQAGKAMPIKQRNTMMIQRWNLLVPATSFDEDYLAEELTPEEFHQLYASYKTREKMADAEDAPAELDEDEESPTLPPAADEAEAENQ